MKVLELKPIVIEASEHAAPCVECQAPVTADNRHILMLHLQSHYADSSPGMYQTKKIIGACSLDCLKKWWAAPDGDFADICTPHCPDGCEHDGTHAFWYSDDPAHQPEVAHDGVLWQKHALWDEHLRLHFALKVAHRHVVEAEAYLPTPKHVNEWWQTEGAEELDHLEALALDAPIGNKPYTLDTMKLRPPTAEEMAGGK